MIQFRTCAASAFFGWLLLRSSLLGGDAADAQLPRYLVSHTADPIRADGKLDETAWASAPWSRDFVWIEAGDPAPLPSRFKALVNRGGLHFAFEFEAPRVAGQPLDPDFPYACEIFLDPQGRGSHYLEYAIAPDGAEHSMIWRGKLSVREWAARRAPRSESGVSRTTLDARRERFVYEVSFPWSGLGPLAGDRRLPPAKGEAWRANFSRVEAGEAQGDYVWAPMGGIYYMHNPGHFGWLVFAGESNPLPNAESIALTPLTDDALTIAGTRRFPLVSRTLWPRWLVPAEDAGFLYLAGKTYVARLDEDGKSEWRLGRTDRLPQFIRSIARVGDKLYLAGQGMNAGVAFVTADGAVHRVAKQEGFVLDVHAVLHSLGDGRAIVVSDNRFQLITPDAILPPVEAAGKVQCAVGVAEDKVVVGTPNGLELYYALGQLIQRTAIAGGVTSLARLDDAAIGASGKNGLYRIDPSGHCAYWPRPLRTKFDGVHVDSRGRCWATYVGGVCLIDAGQVRVFDEPCGVTGLQVKGAAETGDGRMVFSCAVPNANWYGSTLHSSFLLVSDGRRWRKYTFRDGLPGQLNAVTTVGSDAFLCANPGLFKFRP